MTDRGHTGSIYVESQIQLPAAQVRLLHYHFTSAADGKLTGDGKFRVELCLNSRHRSARGCFQGQWKSHRFERIGELFVVHPYAELIARSDESSEMSSIVCELDGGPVLELFESLPEPTDKLLMASLDVREPRVQGLLLRLAEETRYPGFARDMIADLMTRQLTVELLRHGANLQHSETSGGLAPWQLRLIDERLTEIGAAPTLPELAGLCRLSVRQLTRGFRASRDCSIGAYVASSQMEHAKRLLAGGDSVAAIAQTLGFSTSSSFCFAFRRAASMTPKQFRETLLRF